MYEYVDPALIKQLRDLTGLPLLKCRMALLKNDHNVDRALQYLRDEFRRNALVMDSDRRPNLYDQNKNTKTL